MRHTRAVIMAPAKLNLSLDITGEDGAGYHLLDGVMISVGLSDILLLSLREDTQISVSCSGGSVCRNIPVGEENLAAAMARSFFAFTGLPFRGMDIHIHKRIPAQAGLAGGSADAAAVLAGLDHIFNPGLTSGQKTELALSVGSDVPFCLHGGCTRAKGRGELLSPLPMPPDCCFAVAAPEQGMSTRLAFQMYDNRNSEPPRPDTGALISALEKGDLAAIGRAMGNVFECVCAASEAGKLKNIMLAQGALGAAMSGTGTAVAGLFREEDAARRCLLDLREYAPHTFFTHPVSNGAHVIFSD